MEKNRSVSIEKSLPIKIKRYKMLFSYHLRNFWKGMSIWPIILFVISFSLFFLILTPNIVLHRLPIFGEWPRVLEFNGNVYIKTSTDKCNKYNALTKAIIEIGGYKGMTDQEGKFHIKFVSKSSTNIPVIIQWSNNTVIKRVSFEHNEFRKTEVFVVNEQ